MSNLRPTGNSGSGGDGRKGGTASWFMNVSAGAGKAPAEAEEEMVEVEARQSTFPAAFDTYGLRDEAVAVHLLEEADPFMQERHHYHIEDQILLAATAKKVDDDDEDADEGDADGKKRKKHPDDTSYAVLVKQSDDMATADNLRKSAFEREVQRKKERKRLSRMNIKMGIAFVTQTLTDKIAEGRLYAELFVYVPFLIGFIFLYLTGASTEQAYWTKAQLADQFTTGQLPTLESYTWTLNPLMPQGYHISFMLDQVRNAQDWHFWFQSQLLDFVWGADDVNQEELANSFIQGSNMKFGALRIRVLKQQNHTCSTTPPAFPYVNSQEPGFPDPRALGTCYGTFDSGKIERGAQGRADQGKPNLLKFIDCQAASQQQLFGYVENYPCMGLAIEFPAMWSHEQARAQFEMLRGYTGGGLGTVSGSDIANGYVDDLLFHPQATRAVIVEMFTYLPFIDAFQSYKVLTEITTGGRMVHSGRTSTFQIWSLSRDVDYATTIYFFVFYVFVFYYVFKFVHSIIEAGKKDRLPEFVTDFWNLWDLVNLLCFLAVFVCRIVWMRMSFLLSSSQLLTATSYDDRLDFIALMYTLQLWLNGVNTIISFLKILKFVDLNPTLNIVTRTISRAQQSLFGIMVIFVIIIVSYGICGVAIFSNGISDFRDLNTTMSTLMRMLIGDFDYIALRDENRIAAPLYFWTFIILGLFLILNFLIGIILEAFEDESDQTRAEPIPVLLRYFVLGITATVREFWADPKAYMTARRERKASEFAIKSRLETVLEQLTQYRVTLIIDDFSLAELEQLTEAELEALLPDESICRFDLESVFQIADPIDGARRAEWVGSAYFDELWEHCVRKYFVYRLGEAAEEALTLESALEQAAEDALAFVLGIGAGRGSDRAEDKPLLAVGVEAVDEDAVAAETTGARKPSHAAKAAYRAEHARREQLTAVRQLFKPSPASITELHDIETHLRSAHDEAVVIMRALLRELPSTAKDPEMHEHLMTQNQIFNVVREIGGYEGDAQFERVARGADEWSVGTGETGGMSMSHEPFALPQDTGRRDADVPAGDASARPRRERPEEL